MGGCGTLDPTKYDSSTFGPSGSRSSRVQSEISIADWKAVFEKTATNLNSGTDRSGLPAEYVGFRGAGRVLESQSESISPGKIINVADWITVPGVRHKAEASVFSFVKAKNYWVIVFFDSTGNQLAISDPLRSTIPEIGRLEITWNFDKKGSGGEGGNYAITHTVYKASLQTGNDLMLESNEHYELREMFGLSWKKGDLKSVAVFPRIE
jgi:hypothetical protein